MHHPNMQIQSIAIELFIEVLKARTIDEIGRLRSPDSDSPRADDLKKCIISGPGEMRVKAADAYLEVYTPHLDYRPGNRGVDHLYLPNYTAIHNWILDLAEDSNVPFQTREKFGMTIAQYFVESQRFDKLDEMSKRKKLPTLVSDYVSNQLHKFARTLAESLSLPDRAKYVRTVTAASVAKTPQPKTRPGSGRLS